MSTTPLINAAPPNYNFCERILRTAVYQMGVREVGWMERFFVFWFAPGNGKKCLSKGFDSERAEETRHIFKGLGGIEKFIAVDQGRAKIHSFHFRAQDFKDLIEALGGEWRKVTDENKCSLFVIVPPQESSEKWTSFEQAIKKFRWPKREIDLEGENREVIVTCENAASIDNEQFGEFLFLHTVSPSNASCMMGVRIGFYLGCGQNVCVYDPPGVWLSSGTPSEGLAYDALEALFLYLKKKYEYKESQTWLSGECGGNFAPAYVKQKYHEEGINYLHERGAWELSEDFIAGLGWIPRTFANHFYDSLQRRDSSDSQSLEIGFKISEMWKELQLSNCGKIAVISINNDEFIKKEATQRGLTLAKSVNQCVKHIHFTSSKQKEPHTDQFYRYQEPREKLLKFIFQKQK